MTQADVLAYCRRCYTVDAINEVLAALAAGACETWMAEELDICAEHMAERQERDKDQEDLLSRQSDRRDRRIDDDMLRVLGGAL